jgi:hypothetical protein
MFAWCGISCATSLARPGWSSSTSLLRRGSTPLSSPRSGRTGRATSAERIDSWNQQLREEGRQRGRQEGRQEGEARLLLRLLEKRFGSVDQDTRDRIAAADADLLLEWSDRFPGAGSLAEIFGD